MRGRARSPHFPGGREKVPAAAICPLPSALSVLPLLHPQLLLTRLVHEVHELGAGEASGGPRHLLEVCRQAEGRQAGRQAECQARQVGEERRGKASHEKARGMLRRPSARWVSCRQAGMRSPRLGSTFLSRACTLRMPMRPCRQQQVPGTHHQTSSTSDGVGRADPVADCRRPPARAARPARTPRTRLDVWQGQVHDAVKAAGAGERLVEC